MKKFLKDLFYDKNSRLFVRIFSAASLIYLFAYQGLEIFLGHNFHPIEFAAGISVLLGVVISGITANERLRRRGE